MITGHECAGIIVEVGKNLTDKYKKGQRFVLQPAMGLPSGYSAGYSYEYFGGNATYMIIPEVAINPMRFALPRLLFCRRLIGRTDVLYYWRV